MNATSRLFALSLAVTAATLAGGCGIEADVCPLAASGSYTDATFVDPACHATSLVGMTMANTVLERGRFDLALMANFTATQSRWFFVDAEGVDLTGASFTATQLNDVDLELATLTGATFTNVYGRGTNFGQSTLDSARFVAQAQLRTQFVGASFAYASMRGAVLDKVLFVNADFRGTDLTGATLRCNDFSNARFQGADMTDANLTFSYIGRDRPQNLSGVYWNNTTCPDGTNSDDNGGTCIGHLHFDRVEGGCDPLTPPAQQ